MKLGRRLIRFISETLQLTHCADATLHLLMLKPSLGDVHHQLKLPVALGFFSHVLITAVGHFNILHSNIRVYSGS